MRVLVIEDHNVVITGLRSYFRPSRDSIEISLNAGTVEEALLIDSGSFDVILLDLWLPKGDPVENFKEVQHHFPDKPIVIYTAERSLHWQRKMYKAGARGFLGKDSKKAEIHSVLTRVGRSETVYTEVMTAYEAKSTIEGFRDEKYGLTDDHKEIIHWFLEGLTSKDIAGRLGKDRSTIDKALRHIRKIFEVENDIELIKLLLKLDSSQSLDSR